MNTQGAKILQLGHGIKATPSIKQIPGFSAIDGINPRKESPIILYNLKNSSANKILDVKTNNILLTV